MPIGILYQYTFDACRTVSGEFNILATKISNILIKSH